MTHLWIALWKLCEYAPIRVTLDLAIAAIVAIQANDCYVKVNRWRKMRREGRRDSSIRALEELLALPDPRVLRGGGRWNPR